MASLSLSFGLSTYPPKHGPAIGVIPGLQPIYPSNFPSKLFPDSHWYYVKLFWSNPPRAYVLYIIVPPAYFLNVAFLVQC